jgi:hypothetical protein
VSPDKAPATTSSDELLEHHQWNRDLLRDWVGLAVLPLALLVHEAAGGSGSLALAAMGLNGASGAPMPLYRHTGCF